MKINKLFFIMMVIGNCLSCYARTEHFRKPWTIVIYMAAANNVNKSFLDQLKDITYLPENPYAHVLVYVTLKNADGQKQTKRLALSKGGLRLVGPVMQRDSGHIASLAEALQWALLDYPSDHIAVILSGQGSGPLNTDQPISKGICYDCDSGNYLTDKDCRDALEWIHTKLMNEEKIDVLACEAPFFSSIEIAYTFAPFVDYLIAPEGPVSTKRLSYAGVISALNNEHITPQKFSQLLTSAYAKRLLHHEIPLSVVDLSQVDRLVDNMNALGQILSSHLQGKHHEKAKSLIKKCVHKNSCPSFCHGWYIDLVTFYQNLLKQSDSLKLSQAINDQAKRLLADGTNLMKKMISFRPATETDKPLGGLSVYFPRNTVQPSYYGLHWTENNVLWLNFLEAFVE